MMENESGSGDERRQPGRIRNILFSPLVKTLLKAALAAAIIIS